MPTQTEDPGTEVSSTGIAPTESTGPDEQQTATQQTASGGSQATTTGPTTATESTTLSTIALSNTAATSTATTQIPELSTTSSPSSSANTRAHKNKKKKLSTALIIAISCSAFALVAIIGAIMFCCLRQRRRRQQSQNTNTPSSSTSSLKKPRKKLQKKDITLKIRSSGHGLTSFSHLVNQAELGSSYTGGGGFVPVPLNPHRESSQRPAAVDAWHKRNMEENKRLNSTRTSRVLFSSDASAHLTPPPPPPRISGPRSFKPSLYQQSDRYQQQQRQSSNQASKPLNYVMTPIDLERQTRSSTTPKIRFPWNGGSDMLSSFWKDDHGHEYFGQQSKHRYPSSVYSQSVKVYPQSEKVSLRQGPAVARENAVTVWPERPKSVTASIDSDMI